MVARRIGEGSSGLAAAEGGKKKKSDPLMMSGLNAEAVAERVAERNPPKEPSLSAKVAAAREVRLSSKVGGDAPPPNTQFQEAPPDEPPPIDKSHYLDKITAYRERFPNLKSRNKLSGKSSDDEVLDELAYIETQLGSGQSDGNMGCMLLHGAMSGLEASTAVWNPLGLQLYGLGDITKNNMEKFKPIVDELVIKYTTGMYMGPEMRLVLHVGALVMTVHAANSGSPALSEALNRAGIPVDPSVANTDL